MAVITSYLDIISLAQAKVYLRVDDTLTEDDEDIKQMIKGAFLFIERYTNHLFGARDLNQYVPPKIYNYPINSIEPIPDEDWNNYYQRNMDMYCSEFPTPVLTTYNAGYVNTEDVPSDFIQSAKQILKVWYYESEKQTNDQIIPMATRQVLDTYRRFV